MTEKCIVCDKPAEWVRSTQFAGDHPYCEHHAKKEDDFGQNDSYAYWYKIEEKMKRYNERFDAYYDSTTKEWLESKCDDEDCDYCPNRPDTPPSFEKGDRVLVLPNNMEATVINQRICYDGSETFWGNVEVKYDDDVTGVSNSWQLKMIKENE